MKRLLPLSAVLFTAALSACSSDSSSGLSLPAVAAIVVEAKPAALDSSTGLLNRQARSALDVSAFVTCSYGSASDILACLAGNVLADPVPTDGAVGEQLFHWLGNFDDAMDELETRFADASPDCASADPVEVALTLAGYSATIQLQCREQDDVSTRAFGVGADGKTYLVNFSNPYSTNSTEDIATVAVVSEDGDQVDAWVLINSIDALAENGKPTVQRISANRSGSFNYESRSVSGSGKNFEHIVLIGNGTFLNGTGANGTGTGFTEFCVNPATGDALTSECDSAEFPPTDLTGDGTVEIPSLSGQEQTITEAISALVATDLSAVSSVE